MKFFFNENSFSMQAIFFMKMIFQYKQIFNANYFLWK
jgi:hypothetical protein